MTIGEFFRVFIHYTAGLPSIATSRNTEETELKITMLSRRAWMASTVVLLAALPLTGALAAPFESNRKVMVEILSNDERPGSRGQGTPNGPWECLGRWILVLGCLQAPLDGQAAALRSRAARE